MSRLSLQVLYLWRHVLLTAPPFILWWSNVEILFAPLYRSSPFIRGLRCQAIQTEQGPYITERIPKAVYMWDVYEYRAFCQASLEIGPPEKDLIYGREQAEPKKCRKGAERKLLYFLGVKPHLKLKPKRRGNVWVSVYFENAVRLIPASWWAIKTMKSCWQSIC
jgi:hypothetical protein